MSKDLKDTWKDTGTVPGYAFRDLGKTLIKTGTTAMKKAEKWANKEDASTVEEQKQETKE